MTLIDDILALPAELRAGRDTQAIADALPHALTVGSVSREGFATWAAKTGLREKIEDYSGVPGHPLRSICLALIDVLRSPTSGIDFSLADNQAMLGAWVAMGEITQAQADDLLALATLSTPIDEMAVRLACWSDNGEWLA